MRLVSFDCGIKNLAICVIEIEKLHEKEILDKLSEIRKKLNKLQKYLPEDLYNDLNKFCQAVFNYTISKRFKILFWKNINLFPVSTELKELKCNGCKRSASVYRSTKLGYCKRHQPKNIRCKPIKERSVKTITKKEISETLVKTLDNYPELLKADYVLIEQQPTKNPKMKTLETMLYCYFIIRGIAENPIKNIELVSPKHKLRGSTQIEKQKINQFFKKSTKNKGYAQRKDVSVQRARSLLNKKWNKFLDENKGKDDDLCDAFLQAYTYFDILNKNK